MHELFAISLNSLGDSIIIMKYVNFTNNVGNCNKIYFELK